METAVDVGASAPANEAVLSAEITNETPEVAAPSIDDDLRNIWDKNNPPRENGRFVSRNPAETTEAAKASDPAAPKVADQTAEKPVEQAAPAIDAPISWSAEQKAKWASLPPDVQTYIAQRDKETHEAITRAGQQIKAFEPIREVIERYGDTFRRNGLQPHDGLARMMAVHDALERDAPGTIKEIAKAYGVNLQGQAEGQPENQSDPRIAELETRLAKAESYLTAQQRQQINAEESALAREIADFAKDKPHFEAVRRVMAGLMSSGAAETMLDAYERAIYADPAIRQSLIADEQQKADAKRKEDAEKRVRDAKKAAGVNVKSSPGSTASARTLDDDLREIANRAYGRS